LIVLWLLLSGASVDGATAHITWTIAPQTDTYTNDQTKLTFRKSMGGFRQTKAKPYDKDGTATFGYSDKYGIITVWLMHRGPMGCGAGVDCAGGQVDQERSFVLRRGKQRGRGTMYHFLKFPDSAGGPVFSEVGAFEVGDFVYCYRATFMDKNGLDDLARFLKEFGVQKVYATRA
jgi:hypothetical protein